MMKQLVFICLFYPVFLAVLKAQVEPPVPQKDHNIYALKPAEEKELLRMVAEGQYKQAIQLVKKHQEPLKKGVKELSYAKRQFSLGKLYALIHDYTEAEKALLEAANIRAQLLGKNHPDCAAVNFVLAELYFEMNDYEQAERLLNDLTSLNTAAFPALELLLPDLQAQLYQKTNHLDLAEPLLLKSQQLRAKRFGKSHPAYVDALMSLAEFYVAANRIAEAEQILLEAINRSKALEGAAKNLEDYFMFHRSFLKDDMLQALRKLAEIHFQRQEFKEAQNLLLDVQNKIVQAYGKNHLWYAQTTVALAEIDLKIGEKALAVNLLEQATASIRNIKGADNMEYLHSLEKLAKAYLEVNEMEKAQNSYKIYLKQFRKYHKDIIHPFTEALNHSASFYLKTGQQAKAKALFLEALAINSRQSNLDWELLLDNCLEFTYFDELEAINSLVGLYQLKENDLYAQFELCQLLLQMNSRVCHRFSEQNNKLRLMKFNSKYTARLMELTEQLLSKSPDKKEYIAKAYTFVEDNKSILLEQSLHAHKARNMSDLPDSLIRIQLKLEKDKAIIEKELLISTNKDLQDILRQELNSVNIKLADFRHQIEKEYPKYFHLKYENSPIQLEDIQASLEEDMLLLEYFQAADQLHLFVISKKNIYLYPIPVSPKVLHQHAQRFRKALSDYQFIKKEELAARDMFIEEAHWLYEHCIKEAVRPYPQNNQLVIIPDGELAHLPFEAFIRQKPATFKSYKDLDYLLKSKTVNYSYSATLWQENNKSKHNRKAGRLLAMAASYSKDSSASQNRSAQVRQIREHLQELPAAKEEVEKLEDIYKGLFLTAAESGEQVFKDTAANFGVIHLAMHALLNKEHPILSFLAFSEDGNSQEDNFLQAYEIAHLHLDAQLVVLSACETGYGKFQQGEGVMSLGRSFMYAGVPSLVVSMWEVNDISTAVIMRNFYQFLNQGMSKSKALQQAKLSYLKATSDFGAHPAFWAAFIQLGDYHPIKISVKRKRSSVLGYLLIGTAAFAALMGVIYWRKSRKKRAAANKK